MLRGFLQNTNFLRALCVLSASLASCLAGALFSGCNERVKIECQNMFSALDTLQKEHITAAPAFDSKAFLEAETSLLKQRDIALPSGTPKARLEQCIGTLNLLSQHFPQSSLREFTLALITSYTRLWDPHTLALSDRALASQSGFRSGFGLTIDRSDQSGRVEIIDVIGGSPAHEAGLKEGMIVSTLNHRYVRELSTAAFNAIVSDRTIDKLVVGVVSGPLRNNSQTSSSSQSNYREYTIKRGFFETSAIKLSASRVRKQNTEYSVGYVKIRSFVGAEAFFAEALRTMRGNDALVLDLRDISGGEIQSAADIADLLVADYETFVGVMGRSGDVSEIVKMRTPGSAWDGPLVVLVNSGTKSAAEILAGALQDYGAIIVGTQTFGKGTRQVLKPLGGFSLSGALLLTDGFTVRPSGKLIQFRGITPDVKLPFHDDERRESHYPHALAPPNDLAPMPGYDPTAVFSRSPNFRKRLLEVESEIRTFIETRGTSTSQEDLQLEAANKVAVFMAAEADALPAPTSPILPNESTALFQKLMSRSQF